MLKFSAGLRCMSVKLTNFVSTNISNSYCAVSTQRLGDKNFNEDRKNEKWDVLSAVCIERTPIISKDLNEIEEKMIRLLQRIEIENSLKSDFEMKYQEEKVQFEKWKKANTQKEDEEASIPSQDFIDKNTEELKAIQFAPRVTEADKTNNMKSLERRLDSYLLLVIKKKLGKQSLWHLPQDKNREDETLRQTAERIVKETFGDKLSVKFRGNAPSGFYKYKYPSSIREKEGQPIGAKVFFYKAKYLGGDFETKSYDDFQWASRNELNKLFIPTYYKNVSMFLIDEEYKEVR